MAELHVFHEGQWKDALANQPYVVYAAPSGPFVPVQELWVMEWTLIGVDPPTYEKEWRRLGGWEPPTVVVPDAALSRGIDIDPPDVVAEWTVVSSPADPRFYHTVDVTWWINGSPIHLDSAPQSGPYPRRWFELGDEVWAVIRYVNNAGVGPSTTTSTLNL